MKKSVKTELTPLEVKEAVLKLGADRSANDLATLIGTTVHKIAGAKRAITCDKQKGINHLTHAEPIEKPKKEAVKLSNQSYNGKEKTRIRKKITVLMTSRPSDKAILTLASWECLTEKAILVINPKQNFVSAENDRETYLKQLETIVSDGLVSIKPNFGNVSELINSANESQYSHLILDFCGQLSTTYEMIKTAFINNIVEVGGYIFLTLNNRGGDEKKPDEITKELKNSIYREMNDLNPKTDKDETKSVEHAVSTLINRLSGFNYRIIYTETYKDTANMIMFTVQRIK